MKSMFFRKIVWAVDALEESENQKNVLYALGALTRPTQAAVEPVYIATTPYVRAKATPPADIEQAFTALAEKRLAELVRKSDIPTMTSGKILVNRKGLLRSEVQSLIDHAKEGDADLIVVATHARRGLSRMVLGSFAETLILRSTLPVLTVNPEAKIRERLSSILLPTTFDDGGRPAFEHVAAFAKVFGARLTLFYKELLLPDSFLSPQVYDYLAENTAQRRAAAQEWKAWATQYGVPTEIVIDEKPGYPVPAIQEFATRGNFDLIAVPSQADPVSAAVIGSVARGLVRGAQCPVWVMRSPVHEA